MKNHIARFSRDEVYFVNEDNCFNQCINAALVWPFCTLSVNICSFTLENYIDILELNI